MSNSWQEWEVAHLVSAYSERFRGERLGEPVLNDDGSEDLMFDFRFDDAEPPVALEVTSIVDPPFITAARIANRVADELSQIVTREGLGRWYVEVVAGTRLKPLQSRILDAIRVNAPTPPPGISDIRRVPRGDPGVVIYTWGSDPDRTTTPLPGFVKELDEAVRSNQSKLAAAVGFERQLAVDLIDMRAEDPASTPVPTLPKDIDVLWVFNRSIASSRTEPMAWWSTGGDWSLSRPWPPVATCSFCNEVNPDHAPWRCREFR